MTSDPAVLALLLPSRKEIKGVARLWRMTVADREIGHGTGVEICYRAIGVFKKRD